MNIAVLFDGAGLARLGLEQAGHKCTGYELNPVKHYLSKMVGSGNSILADVCDVDLSKYDAVWASPPCQAHSDQNHGRIRNTPYANSDLLEWSLNIKCGILWVENVISSSSTKLIENYNRQVIVNRYNAAQFLELPIQKRRRFIVGRHFSPITYRPFKSNYPKLDICPAILASEYGHGGLNNDSTKERRKASKWYGRGLSIREMAYHQGLEIPDGILKSWFYKPSILNENGRPYTQKQWFKVLSQAIGNGVPVYMAKAFGKVYSDFSDADIRQPALFRLSA